jgi:hypothetical protein
MPYYLQEVDVPRCSYMLCSKKATHRMYRSGTDARAFYCKKHGEAAVKRMNEDEARWAALRRQDDKP